VGLNGRRINEYAATQPQANQLPMNLNFLDRLLSQRPRLIVVPNAGGWSLSGSSRSERSGAN
jgi:hypothetical protein